MRRGYECPSPHSCSRYCGYALWLGDGAIEIRQHGLAEILLQMQVEGIQQIVFGSKVAKQCPFSDARITGN